MSDLHTRPEYAYFPESGVLSYCTVMEDGSAVEVARVGRDGVVGLRLLSGARQLSTRVTWVVSGDAFRIPADTFLKLATEDGFAGTLGAFLHALFEQIAQTSGCNRRHTILQRAVRILLLTHDRVDGDEFPITQETLASLLGVERPKMTQAAQSLHRRGLISYRRGIMRIQDRVGLLEVACECYAVIAKTFPGVPGRS